jgi:hypothetical protein
MTTRGKRRVPLQPVTPVHRPPSLRGIPPRYQVFDRRVSPPPSVARFYRDPDSDGLLVFEVYDDFFREFLKNDEAFQGKRFVWLIDVDPDAPHDTHNTIVRPHPMPEPTLRASSDDPPLELDAAIAACAATGYYRVVKASDPV